MDLDARFSYMAPRPLGFVSCPYLCIHVLQRIHCQESCLLALCYKLFFLQNHQKNINVHENIISAGFVPHQIWQLVMIPRTIKIMQSTRICMSPYLTRRARSAEGSSTPSGMKASCRIDILFFQTWWQVDAAAVSCPTLGTKRFLVVVALRKVVEVVEHLQPSTHVWLIPRVVKRAHRGGSTIEAWGYFFQGSDECISQTSVFPGVPAQKVSPSFQTEVRTLKRNDINVSDTEHPQLPCIATLWMLQMNSISSKNNKAPRPWMTKMRTKQQCHAAPHVLV